MRKAMISVALVAFGVALAGPSFARAPDNYELCRDIQKGRSVTGTVVGGALGALAGAGVAADNAETEGAAIGAILGGLAGSNVGKRTVKCSDEDYRYSRGYGDRPGTNYGTRETRYGYGDDDYYGDDDRYGNNVGYGRDDDDYNSYGDVERYRGNHTSSCRILYSTTRLPNGGYVKEPVRYCQRPDGSWRRN